MANLDAWFNESMSMFGDIPGAAADIYDFYQWESENIQASYDACKANAKLLEAQIKASLY